MWSLLILLVSLPFLARAEDGDLLDRIMAAQAGRTIAVGELERAVQQADFPEDPPQIWHIRLQVHAPDRYRIRIQQAGAPSYEYEAFVSDGETRWHIESMWEDEAPDVTARPVSAGDEGLGRVRDFFPLNRTALERDFDLAAVDDGSTYRVDLTPIAEDISNKVDQIALRFDRDYELQHIELRFASGDIDSFTVQEMDFPAHIDPSGFTVTE